MNDDTSQLYVTVTLLASYFYVTVTLFKRCHDASILGSMKKIEPSAVTRESDKFMLRFPDGMRERIAGAAKVSGRSMNSEITARLQESFDPAPSPITWPDLIELLHAEAKKRGAQVKITIG